MRPKRTHSGRGVTRRPINPLSSLVCEYVVKTDFNKRAPWSCLLLATSLLSACAAPPPKDFGGKWKPVNHFQDTTSEIPLNQAYTYYASPMDETLRTMLRRWTKDSGLQFSYQLQSDYTLYKAVTQIHTTDVYAATQQLSSIYAAQGVSVTTDGRQVLVGVASASSNGATNSATPSAAPANAPSSAPQEAPKAAPQDTAPAQAK